MQPSVFMLGGEIFGVFGPSISLYALVSFVDHPVKRKASLKC